MLQVTKLSCSRNEKVLFRNLNFRLQAGESMQIMGANGVGKTTLLKILAGLFHAYTGYIATDYTILYLGHHQNLHPALTALENLTFLTRLHGSAIITASELRSALSSVALAHMCDKPCEELSAGQLQRTNLALLYLTRAKLWLLDEPLINLDAAGRELCQDLCLQHLAKGGCLVTATHERLQFSGAPLHDLDLQQYA